MNVLAIDHAPELGDAAQKALGGYDIRHRLEVMRQGGWNETNWRAFAADGWLGMLVPATGGGSALTAGEAGSILRSFGRRVVCEPVLPVAVTAVTLLKNCAETPARSAALAAIARGEMRPVVMPALGPAAGVPVAGAAAATHLIGASESGAARIVSVTAPGIEITPTRAIDGTSLGRISFAEVALKSGEELRAGPEAWTESAAVTRIGAAFWMLGLIDTALEMTLAHVSQREQFGKPLGEFQSVRHRIAGMVIAENMASAAMARNLAVDHHLRHEAATAAYLAVLKASLSVTRDAIQLHGGMGMTDELEISHLYRTVLALAAAYGSVRDHCDVLTLHNPAGVLSASD